MEIHASLWTQFIAWVLKVEDAHAFRFYDHVVASGIVFIVLTVMAILTKSRMKLIPGNGQQIMEMVVSGIDGMLKENMGEHGRKHLPLIGTLAFFIFISNFIGMVPGFSSGTSNLNTTVGCSLIVFFYYNWEGIKEHGPAYIKQFTGPMALLIPIMLPIEIISHLARPFSLSVRLFGNISGEHIVTAVFYLEIFAWLVPMPLMVLGLFASFLQAFVFIMLSMVYIGGAISHDH